MKSLSGSITTARLRVSSVVLDGEAYVSTTTVDMTLMLSGIGAALACEAGRQTVEHGAAARRRPQVLMYGKPQAEVEIEGVR